MNADDLVQQVYKAYEDRNDREAERQYLGCSSLGDECAAKVAYLYSHAAESTFDGRMLRLFQTGHLEEERFAQDLRSIGFEVVTDRAGKQIEVSDDSGHLKGHIDGLVNINGDWLLLEMKTHSQKSFDLLTSKGLAASKPEHVGQMQLYMGFLGISCGGLYMAKNKNTDELHFEFVKFSVAHYERLLARGKSIIASEEQVKSPSYKCNWCPAKAVCGPKGRMGDEIAVPLARRSCRQCRHYVAANGGLAGCMKHKCELPFPAVKVGCDDHTLRPEYLTFAHIEDEDEGLYVNEVNNETFKIGPDGYTTEMLMKLTINSITAQNDVQELAKTFKSTEIVVQGNDDSDDLPF